MLEQAEEELKTLKHKYSELEASFATYRKDTSEEIMIEENYIAQAKIFKNLKLRQFSKSFSRKKYTVYDVQYIIYNNLVISLSAYLYQ